VAATYLAAIPLAWPETFLPKLLAEAFTRPARARCGARLCVFLLAPMELAKMAGT
jgi:hypothetical protein